MLSIFQIDWESVFVPSLSILEIVLRGSLIYLFLFIVLRVLRRGAGAIGISDLLVVVLIAGYSPTEKTSDVLFSLAVYPRGVSLYFMYGRSLPDPHKLLQGNGNQGAFVRLDDLSVLDQPGVKALLKAAVQQATPLPASGKGYTVVKSISAKQRPRRPKQK